MGNDEILVAAMYKFVRLPSFRTLQVHLLEKGQIANLCGSVLLAEEGLNGTIAGSHESVREFVQDLRGMAEFTDLPVKFSTCGARPFRQWKVRLKKEIVTLREEFADPIETPGKRVTAEQWNELLSDSSVAVIDVRNQFEIELGTFPNAINPRTTRFSEFGEYVETQQWDKEKPLAIFCTGGIRCEKAAAYLQSAGFTNIKQLDGGILNYLQSVPADQNRWQGACFVFDERIALDKNLRPIDEKRDSTL